MEHHKQHLGHGTSYRYSPTPRTWNIINNLEEINISTYLYFSPRYESVHTANEAVIDTEDGR